MQCKIEDIILINDEYWQKRATQHLRTLTIIMPWILSHTLNIWFSVAHTIHHQPTLIVLQSLRVSRDTWCYGKSHENNCNQYSTPILVPH